MFQRFTTLTEEQLNIAIAILGASCVVALLILGLLFSTGAADGMVYAAGLAEDGRLAQPTATPVDRSILPATWTPRATFTPTPTFTPEPTETATLEPSATATATVVELTETPEPNFAATIEAEQTRQAATRVVPPSPAPPVVNVPPPTPIPPPPPPTPIPPPPPPTNTPAPTPTPQPLYVLSDLLGGPDCSYSGISGTVRNNDGTPRAGVTVEVFNEFGYQQSLTTNDAGFYQAFLDSQPRADLAGNWHIRVLENGVQGSNEIIVIMSGSCNANDLTKFVANFYRTQ